MQICTYLHTYNIIQIYTYLHTYVHTLRVMVLVVLQYEEFTGAKKLKESVMPFFI